MADKNTTNTTTNTTSISGQGTEKVIEKTTGLVEVINKSIDQGIETQLSAVDKAVENQLKRADKLKADEIKAGVAVALDEAVEARNSKLVERVETSRYNLNEAKVKLGQADRRIAILEDKIAKDGEGVAELKADLKRVQAERKSFKETVISLESKVESRDSKINELQRVISKHEKNIFVNAKKFDAELAHEVELAKKELAIEKTQMATDMLELTIENERLESQVAMLADIIDRTSHMTFGQRFKFLFGGK